MSEPRQTAKCTTGRVVQFKPEAAPPPHQASTLTFTWEALERQLADLAVTSQQRALVKTLVSGTRKQAAFKPPELILREVLCIASVLMDETFRPDSKEGEMS